MNKKKKWIKRVILIVLLLAILAGIGYLGWLLYGKPPAVNENPPSTRGRIDLEEAPKNYVIENGNLRLTLYTATTQFKLEELDGKTVRRTWFSNPSNVETGEVKDDVAVGAQKQNDMRSTLVVHYSSASADKPLDNWNYSIEKQAYSIDKIDDTTLEVHYTIGQIQGVSRLPKVITEKRWGEIQDTFNELKSDGAQRVKLNAFTNAYEAGRTIHQLALDAAVENRQLAAHLIETQIADDAMNSETYSWVKTIVQSLNEASELPYSEEETLALINAHAEELGEAEAQALRDFAAGDEEAHKEAVKLLEETVIPALAKAAEEAAEEPAAEAAETAGEETEAEAEEDEAWAETLKDLFERPVKEPFDAETLIAEINGQKDAEAAGASAGGFFSDEAWTQTLQNLIRLDEETLAAEQLTNPSEAYQLAAERMNERIVEIQMSLPENAWAADLVETINSANAAESFDDKPIRDKLEEIEQDEAHKTFLSGEKNKYHVAKFWTASAKENLTAFLEGGLAAGKAYAGIDYSEEQYLEDAKWELPADDNATVAFNVTVRYRLDGPDLVVEVPYDQIRCNNEAPITYVTVLPMFGAAGKNLSGEYDEDGFIFVPEGGGALIRYNNGKLQQNNYIANLYGWDYASKREEAFTETKSSFPVFGMTYSKHKDTNDNSRDAADAGSFLCIIEQGSSYAAIQADINGRQGVRSAFHPNGYNTVSAKYHVLHSDQYNVSAKTANMVIMYENAMPQETVVQRYRFLDSNSYVDMANTYGDYLRAAYPELSETDTSEEMPIAVEFVGAIDKKVVVAGLPVNKTVPVTTFKQAREITDNLLGSGIRGLNLRYTGWANGGVSQKVLTGVHVEGVLGGENGMRELIAYAKNQRIPLYFDGVTCFAYRSGLTDGFVATSNAARYTTHELVELIPYSQIYYTTDDERDAYYLVKPGYAANNATNLINFMRRVSAEGVAFRDIGYVLSGNYDRNDIVTREHVKQMNVETLKQARGVGQKVMIKEGYDYAMPYADLITSMDLGGIRYSILDESVPFYQIAIHGSVDYTGKPLNMVEDWKEELLRCAEYGAGLSFTFMYEDGEILQDTLHSDYAGANWDGWKHTAMAVAKQYQEAMTGLNRSRIVSHVGLPLGVKMTRYDDGTRVYVNYGYSDYTLTDGTTVPARDYLVCRGQEPNAESKKWVAGQANEDFQAVVEPNGARNLVNYTANTYTAGDNTVYPSTTTRIKDGEIIDVVFREGGSRVYVNADSEPILVAGGQTVEPGAFLEVTDDTEFEAIFTSDGRALYANYTDTDMLAGGVTVKARNYARVANAAGLDAVVVAPAPSEEAEAPELYRVVWVNFTDAPVAAAGEEVPAKGYLWSESEKPVIAAFCPDGSRLFINRTADALNAGEKMAVTVDDSGNEKSEKVTNTVAAHNYLALTDAQPYDVICTGGGKRVYVNNTDTDVDIAGTAVPAKSFAEAEGGDAVEVIFLPDGTRIYANYTDAVIRSGATNIAANNTFLMTDGNLLDTIVAELTVPAAEEGAEPLKQRVSIWVNGADEAVVIEGTEVPAKGKAVFDVADADIEIVALPGGTFRIIRHVGMPPQLQIAGVTIQGATWADVDAIPEGTAAGYDGVVRFLNLTEADTVIDGFTIPAGGSGTNAVPEPEPEPAAEEETPAAEEETQTEGGEN